MGGGRCYSRPYEGGFHCNAGFVTVQGLCDGMEPSSRLCQKLKVSKRLRIPITHILSRHD